MILSLCAIIIGTNFAIIDNDNDGALYKNNTKDVEKYTTFEVLVFISCI